MIRRDNSTNVKNHPKTLPASIVQIWPEFGALFLKVLIPVNLHYNQGIKFSTVLVLSAILLIMVIVLGELNII